MSEVSSKNSKFGADDDVCDDGDDVRKRYFSYSVVLFPVPSIDFRTYDLKWDYKKGEVILSMKGYVIKALKEFQHKKPTNDVLLRNGMVGWWLLLFGSPQQSEYINYYRVF